MRTHVDPVEVDVLADRRRLSYQECKFNTPRVYVEAYIATGKGKGWHRV